MCQDSSWVTYHRFENIAKSRCGDLALKSGRRRAKRRFLPERDQDTWPMDSNRDDILQNTIASTYYEDLLSNEGEYSRNTRTRQSLEMPTRCRSHVEFRRVSYLPERK